MISLLGGHIKLIKMIPYLYQSLKCSFDRCRHVLALFNVSCNKNIELNERIISSKNCPKGYHWLFLSDVQQGICLELLQCWQKNLNVTNIRESVRPAFKRIWLLFSSEDCLDFGRVIQILTTIQTFPIQ